MNRHSRLLLFAVAILAVLASPTAALAQSKLVGTVGPGFTISLRTASGGAVQDLAPGTYEIEVRDLSEDHNFHLSGPGVDMSTTVGFFGTVTWTVSFQAGSRYAFVCDPHATSMRGSFQTTGGAPSPPPPAPAPKPPTLTATVGPVFTISLRTSRGARVNRLKAGRYRIVVRDRSAVHNFHLSGLGVNKRTGVRFRGTVTWTVTFRKGKAYRFVCDRHARQLRGGFRAT